MPKLLIVDDVPEVFDMLTPLLTSKGFACEGAINAEEALKLLVENTYDIVLIDYVMPGYDGLKLCQEIMAGNGIAARVILMSGYLDDNVRRQAASLGIKDVIEKPFDMDKLLAIVKR